MFLYLTISLYEYLFTLIIRYICVIVFLIVSKF